MGTPLAVAEAETDVFKKAAGYRLTGETVDGMDVVAVETAARRAVEAIRTGGGPHLLECRTYRFRAHSMFDAQLYRPKDEIEMWRKRGPILRFQSWLEASNLLHPGEIEAIEAEINVEVEGAVAFAEAGRFEPVEDLERFLVIDKVPA
jgi:pyruvate dehydrogenase E1 component alpha subunit/2-oxoisovalerate dehydrogenase E1 component